MYSDYCSPVSYALREAFKEKERKKLRFAKCTECGRSTPFKLESVYDNAIRCKCCGNLIPIFKKL